MHAAKQIAKGVKTNVKLMRTTCSSESISYYIIEKSFIADKVFSAMETAPKKSSIVAINVRNFVSHWIFVSTLFPRFVVFMNKPCGTFWLSGVTAFATASASLIVS
jgi:hypothetical protein